MNESTSDADRVRERIEKLLAMARDGRGNENEAETAMRMAEKLMRQHNIDIAELQARTGQKPTYDFRGIVVPIGDHGIRASWRPMWIGYLAVGVATFTDCRATWVGEHPVHGFAMSFQGDAVDLEYCQWLFEHLRDFGYRESMSVSGNCRENFRKAYSIRIQGRLQELRSERNQAMQEAKVAGGGTALVVLQNKLQLRDQHFGGAWKTKAKAANLRNAGFKEGVAAANRANFNRPVGTTSGRLAIGG